MLWNWTDIFDQTNKKLFCTRSQAIKLPHALPIHEVPKSNNWLRSVFSLNWHRSPNCAIEPIFFGNYRSVPIVDSEIVTWNRKNIFDFDFLKLYGFPYWCLGWGKLQYLSLIASRSRMKWSAHLGIFNSSKLIGSINSHGDPLVSMVSIFDVETVLQNKTKNLMIDTLLHSVNC